MDDTVADALRLVLDKLKISGRYDIGSMVDEAVRFLENELREHDALRGVKAAKLLCHCETGNYPGEPQDADWRRFEEAARQSGHASGHSAANDRGLWALPVDTAIAMMLEEARDASTA